MKNRILALAAIVCLIVCLWLLRRAVFAPPSSDSARETGIPSRGATAAGRAAEPRRAVPRFQTERDASAEIEDPDGIVVVGRVVDHDTDAPVGGVRVEVRGFASLLPIGTATDSHGQFKLANLIDAPTVVLSFDAADRGHASELRRIRLPRNGTVDAGTIPLFRTDPQNLSRSNLGLRLSSQDGTTVVRALQPGSPAELAGLRLNDVIVEINGEEPMGDELRS